MIQYNHTQTRESNLTISEFQDEAYSLDVNEKSLMMSQNRASIWLEILGKAINNVSFLARQDGQHVNCFCRTSCVSVGYNVYVVPALIFGHTPVAKSFHQLRLRTLSIQNVSLCRSEYRDTATTSIMEVFVTIVNDWLKVNYCRRELFLDIGSGSEDFRKVGSFFQSKLKDSLQQIKNNQSILCQSYLFC